MEAKSLEAEVGDGIASGQGKKIVWQVVDDNVGPTASFVYPVDGASMVLIPGSSFEMSDKLPEAGYVFSGLDSLPRHEVILDAFYMDVHEVTVGQFKQFMEETGYDYQRNWNSVALQSPTEGFVV